MPDFFNHTFEMTRKPSAGQVPESPGFMALLCFFSTSKRRLDPPWISAIPAQTCECRKLNRCSVRKSADKQD